MAISFCSKVNIRVSHSLRHSDNVDSIFNLEDCKIVVEIMKRKLSYSGDWGASRKANINICSIVSVSNPKR